MIARYSISNQAFVNLDNLAEYDSWLKTAGHGENEETGSFLDDWIDEDELDDDFEDEDFEEDPEDGS